LAYTTSAYACDNGVKQVLLVQETALQLAATELQLGSCNSGALCIHVSTPHTTLAVQSSNKE